MATIKGIINISGTYVAHHKFHPFFTYVLCILEN